MKGVDRVLDARVRPGWKLTVVPTEPTRTGDAALAELDEKALVRACLDGQREAFDLLVERHRRSIYQVCYRFVANHEDASDLAQEVFLRAFRGLNRFKGDASLATWLYRIAVNVSLNRVTAKSLPTEPLEAREHVQHGEPDPAESVLRAERSRRVRAAIARLPRKQRVTLILRVYHDMPHQQIAAIVGTSVGAVKANFFHALRNLKKALGGEMP